MSIVRLCRPSISIIISKTCVSASYRNEWIDQIMRRCHFILSEVILVLHVKWILVLFLRRIVHHTCDQCIGWKQLSFFIFFLQKYGKWYQPDEKLNYFWKSVVVPFSSHEMLGNCFKVELKTFFSLSLSSLGSHKLWIYDNITFPPVSISLNRFRIARRLRVWWRVHVCGLRRYIYF